MSRDPEYELPVEPYQEGPLPSCRPCGNNGLRTRRWRNWRVMHCGHCGHGWREKLPRARQPWWVTPR